MKEVCKNCMCYSDDGWCEAFVVQKLPNTKGCFGFIPNEPESDDTVTLNAANVEKAKGGK